MDQVGINRAPALARTSWTGSAPAVVERNRRRAARLQSSRPSMHGGPVKAAPAPPYGPVLGCCAYATFVGDGADYACAARVWAQSVLETGTAHPVIIVATTHMQGGLGNLSGQVRLAHYPRHLLWGHAYHGCTYYGRCGWCTTRPHRRWASVTSPSPLESCGRANCPTRAWCTWMPTPWCSAASTTSSNPKPKPNPNPNRHPNRHRHRHRHPNTNPNPNPNPNQVLRSLDHLFALGPRVGFAAPRAYWLPQPFFQSGGPMLINTSRHVP